MCTFVVALARDWILVLKVNRPEVGMVVVAVPSTAESRVRVRVVDAVVLVVCRESPLDVECGCFWAGRRENTGGICLCTKRLLDDAVWLVGDGRDDGIALEDVP